MTIYTLIVAPFILVFYEEYQVWEKLDEDGKTLNAASEGLFFSYDDSYKKIYQNDQLVQIEYIIDVIFCIEILFNFVKRSNAYSDIKKISANYLQGKFIFDVLATVPGLANQ